MHIRQKLFRLNTVIPNNLLSILAIKSHVSNIDKVNEAEELIKSNEEYIQVECGRSKHVLNIRED